MKAPLLPGVRALYADGDWLIALFDAAGAARDGLPHASTYSWYLRLEAGEIVEAIAFFDSIAFNHLWSRVAVG